MRLLTRLNFSIAQIQAPRINVARYLGQEKGWEDDCKVVADALHKYGLLYVEDKRANPAHNEEFLDLMESYFIKRSRQFDEGLRNIDIFERLPTQNPKGLRHGYTEKFINYKKEKDSLKHPYLSQTPDENVPSPTWRFNYIVGKQDNVIPSDFPEFDRVMSTWGGHLKNCGLVIAEMAAIGLGLGKNTLLEKIINGQFHLAPPGIDLSKTHLGQVITSFHRDFDLLTIHGRARYSGLYAWLNTGEKFLVKVPENHFLVQGGKQLEWLTGGYIKAGFHEVIHNELVEQAKLKRIKQTGDAWRVASTLFCQVEGTQSIKPLEKFQSEEANRLYPDLTADEYALADLAQLIKGAK